MAKYTQEKRPLNVKTPLGDDVMLVTGFSGDEGLSQLFRYRLDLLVPNSKLSKVAFDKVIGGKITVEVLLGDGGQRYFHGICNRLGQGEKDEEFTEFRMEVVPKFWLLTKRIQSRLFQQKSVPDILKEVLGELDVEYKIQGTFDPRNYCTQYRETDFDFACRLMEEEGIFYFFKHQQSDHKLVVANTPSGHPALSPDKIPFEDVAGGTRDEERIYRWTKHQELTSGKVTLWDDCFERPGSHLDASDQILQSLQVGTKSHKLKVGGNDELEIYDYPGGYAKRFDGVDPGGSDRASDVEKIFKDNARTVGIRMEAEEATSVMAEGTSNCRQLVAGHKFTLQEHFDANGEYVLAAVTHSASQSGYRSDESPEWEYENAFTCIPFALAYRPPRITPKPVVPGSHTAVVVGPSGEEIFTDKYGRVKVQFHWDRDGQKDAGSSCWIRVGTLWAGQQWGMIHIPRIGQEVIVAFLEGDPDRPIIVGSVYNAEQMPPYELPDNKTQSGLKTRSSPKGQSDHFNELRFEDKKGEEQIYLHAEKDFDRVVENNDTLKVGFEKKDEGNQTVEVFNNQSIKVGTAQAKEGSQSVEIWKDRDVKLKTGNDSLLVDKGNRDTVLTKGNDSVRLKMGNQTTKLDLGKSSTEAMKKIVLKVGANSITIDQTGITIKGIQVKVEGSAMLQAKAPVTKVEGSGVLVLKGGMLMIN